MLTNKKFKIIILLVISLIWMLFIFKLSDMNMINSNGKSVKIISIFIEDALDITNEYGITSSYPTNQKLERASNLINQPLRKVMHASVYFILAFIIITAMDIKFEHKKYIISIIITIAICFLFALTDEFHQTFVSGRTGRIMDVFIDTTGSILGTLFYTTYHIIYNLGYKRAIKDNDLKERL